MKWLGATLAMATAIGGIPSMAAAQSSAEFAACDGLDKPKRKSDGMRGPADMPSNDISSPALDALSVLYSGKIGASKVKACDYVLASKKMLSTQTLRRAHLLRARAAAKLAAGDPDGALADIDAAAAVTANYSGEPNFDRSMGVSLDMMRATALADKEQWAEAVKLAQSASEVRPYGLDIQRTAVLIAVLGDEAGAAQSPIVSRAIKLDPSARGLLEEIISRLDYKAPTFEARIEKLRAKPDIMKSPEDFKTLISQSVDKMSSGLKFGTNRIDVSDVLNPLLDAQGLAYAYAAAGQNDKAREQLDMLRQSLEFVPKEGGDRFSAPILTRHIKSRIEPALRLVEMRLDISEGKLNEVGKELNDMELTEAMHSKDLYAAYNAKKAATGSDAPELKPLKPRPKIPIKSGAMAASLLFRPETADSKDVYKKSQPNLLAAGLNVAFTLGTGMLSRIPQTDGFKSSENEDGTIKVEYVGNVTSAPVVQELTLLRAAEIAQGLGKPGFIIQSRKDYTRYLAKTLSGVPISQRVNGYKTELDIQLLEAGDESDYALDPSAVIAELGPQYYSDSKQRSRTARR